jgi:hypothetical protein
MDPVITLHVLVPIHVLDVRALQTQVRRREVFFDAQQVDGGTCGGGPPRLSIDLPAEGLLLEVEEPDGALDVCQRLGPRRSPKLTRGKAEPCGSRPPRNGVSATCNKNREYVFLAKCVVQ